MRIFWKQFMGMIAIVLGTFTLFGIVLIYSTFQSNLDKIRTQTIENLGIYQYSLMTSLDNLPEDYKMTTAAAADIANTIFQSMGDTSNGMSLYDEDGQEIYQSGNLQHPDELEDEDILTLAKHSGLQQIVLIQGEHYLDNTLWLTTSKGTFCLRLEQNIQYIYDNRRQLYDNYQRILLVMLVITMGLSGGFAARFTKPVKSLRRAAERFARGDYASRVEETGSDEMTDLMRTFNDMASQLETDILNLEEAARKQEEFTAAFAHELKTPLTSVIGYAQALQTMELSPQEQRISVDYIYEQGRRLEALAYKMMELTGIRKQEWEFIPVSVPELITKVTQMTAEVLKKGQVHLQCSVEPGYIYGEEYLLESLLANLIDNARKASPQDAVIIITGTRQEQGYELCVRDKGCGIPPEDISKIQEAFYMVDKSRGRKEGGAGLGMALCEQILRLHHGKWEIHSTVGQGTTIVMKFAEVPDEA